MGLRWKCYDSPVTIDAFTLSLMALFSQVFAALVATFLLSVSGIISKSKHPHFLYFLQAMVITGFVSVLGSMAFTSVAVGSVLISMSIISAGLVFKAPKADIGLTRALYIMGVTILSIGVGLGYIFSMIALSVIVVGVAILYRILIPHESRSQSYVLSMDIQKLPVIERIETLFSAFPIKIKHKVLTRQTDIQLDIHYETSPLVQHVLLQRLFRMKGIGRIVKF